uniref:Uncharacterized protein n=1 Tax=Arundo donax TaxID=35708 RepID=A0A0A9AN11_ARUDO
MLAFKIKLELSLHSTFPNNPSSG